MYDDIHKNKKREESKDDFVIVPVEAKIYEKIKKNEALDCYVQRNALPEKKDFDKIEEWFKKGAGDKVKFRRFNYEGRKVVYTEELIKKVSILGVSYSSDLDSKLDTITLGFESKEQEYLQGWQRAKADLVNLQKRVNKEKGEFMKFAKVDVLSDLLEFKDNFDSALEHMPEDLKENNWAKGMIYLENQLQKILEDHGVQVIPVKVGDEFDEEIHEAIRKDTRIQGHKDTNEDTSNKEQTRNKIQDTNGEEIHEEEKEVKIKKILKKGYRMNGKVVRAAVVEVE